jgi:KipI family sensor histidine kinase inhibitor
MAANGFIFPNTIGNSAASCKAARMTLKPLGDSAWLVEFPGESGLAALARVTGLVEALGKNRPDGVLDIVPSFASVAVHYGAADGREIREWIGSVTVEDRLLGGDEKRIPVCYGGEYGPDLRAVATEAGLSEDEVVALHSGALYTVAAVGFSPGFPYLLGLPEPLHVSRRVTPRTDVPAGSVAVAGGQAGIYPFTSPGGWQVLGRTGVALFDPHAVRASLLMPGDRVRFVPVDRMESIRKISVQETDDGACVIEVIHPGGLTTVQDLGRPGHEASGVSPGGAADPQSLRLANLMVGNRDNAAGLEICVSGPVLKFHVDAVIALVSGSGRQFRVKAGETVDFSKPVHGVRACLTIAGGIQVPEILGSRATDVRAGFGGYQGRALRAGDRLETGTASLIPAGGDWHVGRPDRASGIELRFLPGVQQLWFSESARQRFHSEIYQLTPRSDRMGARLAGPALELESPREMISQPVACGSVQVPPDGQPIVLLAERQTIGGYPQIGQVISADLPKLARAWPGTPVRFREVTWEEARAARRQVEENFKWLQTGLKLLK